MSEFTYFPFFSVAIAFTFWRKHFYFQQVFRSAFWYCFFWVFFFLFDFTFNWDTFIWASDFQSNSSRLQAPFLLARPFIYFFKLKSFLKILSPNQNTRQNKSKTKLQQCHYLRCRNCSAKNKKLSCSRPSFSVSGKTHKI